MLNLLLVFTFLIASGLAIESDTDCRVHATILRQIEREGFHIDINSLIELVVNVEKASRWENCSIILRESITNSFYVNPDQLSELNRSGVSQACTLDKIDVEKPQHLAKEHTVFVYGKLQRSQNLIFTHLNLPLHLRYHKPKDNGGYSLGKLNAPVLLINCPNISCKNLLSIRAPCQFCGLMMCIWSKLPYKTNNLNMTLPVPVGNLSHLSLVKFITYILTYGGCFYVVFALFISNDKRVLK